MQNAECIIDRRVLSKDGVCVRERDEGASSKLRVKKARQIREGGEVALEEIALLALHLPVLHSSVIEEHVQLDHFVRCSRVLVL